MFCISTQGSERATTGPGNMIVTANGKTHVVWQDSIQEGYFNRARTLDRASGQWSPVFTLNQGVDNHARPILAIDSRGFLHAVMSGHNSPTTHRQSKRPNDASEWNDPVDIGPGTYPVMACGGDDTLYVTLRSGGHEGVELYVKPPGKSWQKPALIIRRHPDSQGYLGAANGLAFGPDGRTLHMVCDFYEGKDWKESVGLHQAVACMRSPDGGKTWQRADGSPIEIPARPEGMDQLADYISPHEKSHAPPVIAAGGSIVVDSTGKPFVFYSSYLKQPGELILATPDARGQWQQRTIDVFQKSHPGFRCGAKAFTITQDDVLHGVVQLVKNDPAQLQDGFPTRDSMLNPPSDTLVVRLVLRNGGRTMALTAALPTDHPQAWLVSHAGGSTSTRGLMTALPTDPEARLCAFNIERPSVHSPIERGRQPSFTFFHGLQRYRKEGELIQNKVYWFEAPHRKKGELSRHKVSWLKPPAK